MIYNILEYGAIADGVTNNAEAIQQAMNECSRHGGGMVVIPAGIFLSGSIFLRSNVELHLEQGAILRSSLKEEDIHSVDDPEMKEAHADEGWDGGCFISATHEKNITISGCGMIDGQGREVFYEDGADGGFGECPMNIRGYRPRMMLLEDIENLTVKDVTLYDAGFWTLHMAGCRHVRIQGIQVLNNIRGANNDGIDPDCCQDVIISNCIVKAGDDSIVVKSTLPMSKKYGNCENIIITGCILKSQDSALKVGTETHGTIRNIVFGDCIIQDCSRAVGIWVRDGGTVEDIMIHHLKGAVRRYADAPERDFAPRWWGKGEPFFISATYRNEKHEFPGRIQNIQIDNIDLKAESSMFIAGEEDCIIKDIFINQARITMKRQGTQPGGLFDEQPSVKNVYEHKIPGLYARWIDGLYVNDSQVTWTSPAMERWGGLVETENCKNTEINIREYRR